MKIGQEFRNQIQKKYPDRQGTIYGVVSGKGGVGKTSVAALMSYGIASLGYATLVIDMDTGLRNLDVVMGVEDRVVRNLFDVLERGEDFGNAAIRAKKGVDTNGKLIQNDNVPWICLSDQLKIKNAIGKNIFMELLSELRDVFDVIILDSPAGIEYGCRLVTESVDEAFIICTPEMPSLKSVDQLANIFESNIPLSLIVNRVIPELIKVGGGMPVEKISLFTVLPVSAVIPFDPGIIGNGHTGRPVWYWEQSPARQAMLRFIETKFGDKDVLDNQNNPNVSIENMTNKVNENISSNNNNVNQTNDINNVEKTLPANNDTIKYASEINNIVDKKPDIDTKADNKEDTKEEINNNSESKNIEPEVETPVREVGFWHKVRSVFSRS